MENWLKHPKDRVGRIKFAFGSKIVSLFTCSRHDKRGKLQGYIVNVKDSSGVDVIAFKHYRFREVVETYVTVMYKIGNAHII